MTVTRITIGTNKSNSTEISTSPVNNAKEEAKPDFSEAADARDSTTIYILEDDLDLSTMLSLQLAQYGYETRCFTKPEELLQETLKTKPDIIISDIQLLNCTSTQFFIEKKSSGLFSDIPIIFMSRYGGFQQRLESIHAGAKAYFLKPIDIKSFTAQIDSLTKRIQEEPARVLAIDDSKTQTEYLNNVLSQEGMIVHTCNNPELALEILQECKPDVIILDINMPICDGIELAGVIRQFNEYVGIPIVYLSTESAMEKQLEAMKVGGDDFLTKPINHSQLVSTISSRVTRYRALRNLMTRDSLTGLFNHKTLKEKLEHEVNRAHRTESSFAFAMIDIDHFKSVNDTYGHAAGDWVLKSLAILLHQRLRTTDICGRYGGEEFAVVLLDVSLDNAERVVNELRESFSQLLFEADGKHFHCTFSCGLSSFPTYDSSASLNEAADKALYEAKNGGRNQVTLAKT